MYKLIPIVQRFSFDRNKRELLFATITYLQRVHKITYYEMRFTYNYTVSLIERQGILIARL